jgi:PAS domain S-box-containing protein
MSFDTELIRILVLDNERETLKRLENALWIWPHKVANAKSVDEVVTMCQHLAPTALIVDINFAASHSTITTLRKRLPQVPIIALGSRSDDETAGSVLDLGADAFLLREDLHPHTLQDLLQGIQRAPESIKALDVPVHPQMSLPWRDSKIVGALICDITGAIIDVNHCIARWLGYSNAEELIGKYVWRDILDSQTDWSAWKEIAGDMETLLYHSTTVKAKNGSFLWMELEVFAAPSFASHLQAVFVDQTEIALLTGRARDT